MHFLFGLKAAGGAVPVAGRIHIHTVVRKEVSVAPSPGL